MTPKLRPLLISAQERKLSAAAVLAAVCLALAGCASAAVITQPQKEAAMQSIFDCYAKGASQLDDGRSDAATIGEAVAQICKAELQSYINLISANGYEQRLMEDRLSASAPKNATAVVLKLRAKR